MMFRRFSPVLRPYRARLAVALVAATARPLLSAARIWLLKILIDTVVRGGHHSLLGPLAVAFVLIAAVRGLVVHWDEKLSGWVGTQMTRDLRTRTYSHLQGLSLRFYHGQRLGDLLTRLSGDISAIEDLLVSGLSDLVAFTTTILLFVGVLWYLDSTLLLVSFAILPFLALSTLIGARRARHAQQDIRARASHLTSTAEEALSMVALVKAFARGHHERRRFAQATEEAAVARLGSVRVQAVFPPLADLLTAIGTALVVYLGARQVINHHLSLGSLVVFLSYLAALYTPIQGLTSLNTTVQRALVGAERVSEILDAPAEFADRGGPPMPDVLGSVEFRHVTFGYDPDRPVLRDVNLRIEPGEMVALIGPTGAGKTSVVSLLLSYYDPDLGEVLLDGHRASAFSADSVREKIAAVLQEPMLFNTTVRENLRYGRLDATDAEIERAAVIAQADVFIRELPDGYDTMVGPRGSRLSGGQRQRLALARALVKDAPVLVLDEATSALDPKTESAVVDALRPIMADRAVLIVAHRFSTVRHADRIVVLRDGRIVEEGPPDELLNRPDGPYRQFVNEQTEPLRAIRRARTGRPRTGVAVARRRRQDEQDPVEEASR
jgi:ABC-type multidrug transport system fused ATPase/permease subunit